MAVEYGIKFMETSAKSRINVEEAFFTLASDIKAKMEKRTVIMLLIQLVSFIFLRFTHFQEGNQVKVNSGTVLKADTIRKDSWLTRCSLI